MRYCTWVDGRCPACGAREDKASHLLKNRCRPPRPKPKGHGRIFRPQPRKGLPE